MHNTEGYVYADTATTTNGEIAYVPTIVLIQFRITVIV